MKFSEVVRTTCENNPIHGTAYLANKKLHVVEKFFWMIIIISASYFSLNICLDQWQRFRDSPIVYAIELTWNKKDFPYSATTICSDYYSERNTEELIQRIWGLEPNSTKFEYYQKFLKKINMMHYDTMHVLQPYRNDSTLKKLDFLNILLSMRNGELPPENYTEIKEVKKKLTEEEEYLAFLQNRPYDTYAAAITEVGMCVTTSQYSEYTNPYGKIKHLPVTKILFCPIVRQCETKLIPHVAPNFGLTIHLHNIFDVVSPYDRSTITRHVIPDGSLTVELLLGWTSAEQEVRNLPIAYRKCRFPDENNLKYFETYRPGLCRWECHINTALDLCNCKPYFYVVAQHAPICGIKGMLCLVAKNWTQTIQKDCRKNCVPLCEEYTFTEYQNNEKEGSSQFERALYVYQTLPKMAMQRRVIFSTDQLIVALGGAIGLFLGSSFMSVCEIIYLLSNYFGLKIAACFDGKCSHGQEKIQNIKPRVTFSN